MFDLDKLILLDSELKSLLGFQSFFVLKPFHRYTKSYTNMLKLNDEQLLYVSSICKNMLSEYTKKSPGYKTMIKAYFLSLKWRHDTISSK